MIKRYSPGDRVIVRRAWAGEVECEVVHDNHSPGRVEVRCAGRTWLACRAHVRRADGPLPVDPKDSKITQLLAQVVVWRSRAESAENALRDRCENRMDGEEALVASFVHGLRYAADTMERVAGGPMIVGMYLTLRDMAKAIESGEVPMPKATP